MATVKVPIINISIKRDTINKVMVIPFDGGSGSGSAGTVSNIISSFLFPTLKHQN